MSNGLAISMADLVAVAGSDVVVDASKPRRKGVKIRLADGTVRERGSGRMPIGSVVLNDAVEPISLPVESKRKAKSPNYLKLADGQVVVWVRGRHPTGSLKCDANGNLL